MYIDPKDVDLQDAAGMQLVKILPGAHDAYNTGDKVLYPDSEGTIYQSTIDGNVWAPEAYPAGWEVVDE